MASLVCTPNPVNVGQQVTIEGLDFLASTAVTVQVQSPLGRMGIFQSQITSDTSGEIASTDIANYAIGTLTLSANALNNETVTLGSKTYTFKTALTPAANEVLLGASASATLDNLKSAVNLDPAGSGTLYGAATTINADIRASTKTATTILFVAKVGGTGGNALASTETIVTGGSFGGATLSGGAAASGLYTFAFSPTGPGIWVITATDGTNSATANLVVNQSG